MLLFISADWRGVSLSMFDWQEMAGCQNEGYGHTFAQFGLWPSPAIDVELHTKKRLKFAHVILYFLSPYTVGMRHTVMKCLDCSLHVMGRQPVVRGIEEYGPHQHLKEVAVHLQVRTVCLHACAVAEELISYLPCKLTLAVHFSPVSPKFCGLFRWRNNLYNTLTKYLK